MAIIIYEDHIDKDIIRDDILSEIHDKIDNMNLKEVIKLRNIIFQEIEDTNKDELILT